MPNSLEMASSSFCNLTLEVNAEEIGCRMPETKQNQARTGVTHNLILQIRAVHTLEVAT